MIESPAAVFAVLAGTAAFFFWLERATDWRIFRYLVPLVWIYAIPMVLRNAAVLPAESVVYGSLLEYALPSFIVLLLLSVDVAAAVRIMGRGVGVMLLGTFGVVLGAPVGFWVAHAFLGLESRAWSGFGALAGSWIGGSGNMAAVAGAFETPPDIFGLAVLADTAIYIPWLPLLLVSKKFAGRFNRWARIADDRLAKMDVAAAAEVKRERAPRMIDYVNLATLAAAATAVAGWMAPRLPVVGDVLGPSTWNVLLVTTFGIALSFTPAKRIPGSHELAMAMVYVFVARMGATASLAGLAQAPAFLAGTAVWIVIHGLFCVASACFAPFSASARTNGSVTLFNAKVEVRGTAPGMLATQ